MEEIGKQYEEKVIRANLLEPPAPERASVEAVGQRVAGDQERQTQATQAELQQKVACLQATVETMQQQQIEQDAKISERLQAAGEQAVRTGKASFRGPETRHRTDAW